MRLARLAAVCGVGILGGCAAGEPRPLDPRTLEMRIVDARPDSRAGEILILDAVFRNPGTTPIVVIRPQDGSFYGAVPPFVELEVLRLPDLGSVLPLVQGCGNCGGEYTARTMVEVPPGGEAIVRMVAPVFPKEPGRYRVRLRYEIRAGDYPGPRLDIPSADEPRRGDWPPGVFVGVVESAPLEFACGAPR